MPGGQIDHISHSRSDNRWMNLRLVTNLENQRNASLRLDNSSGVQGVYYNKKAKKWQAQISVNGKQVYLGTFEDIGYAAIARKDAERKYGFHNNHGMARV